MKKNNIKKIISILLSLTLMIALCACASKKDNKEKDTAKGELTELTIVLDWTPNTNHTGLYVAQEKGYFEEAGLKVSIIQPPDNGATDLVASGGAQFGIDFQDTLASAFSNKEKLPVTAIAAILQHNTSGIVSLKEKNIDSPKNMENKTYATWDLPVEQAMIKNIVEKDGGDYSKVKLVSTYVENIVAALKTDIDAVWIYYGWDGIKCEIENIDTNYIAFKDINPVFDYYSPVIIGNNNYISENKEITKSFLKAVKQGYEFAANEPEQAASILLKAVPEMDEKLVLESQKYLSKQYITDKKYFGYIDPSRWNNFYNWLNDNNLVENKIPENTGFTNEYLEN